MTKRIGNAEIHADPVTVLSYEDFLLEEPFVVDMTEELEFEVEDISIDYAIVFFDLE